MTYPILDSSRFYDIQQTLKNRPINAEGTKFQIQLLEATCTKNSFIDWVKSNISFDQLNFDDLPLYPEKLTENEFVYMPRQVEIQAYDCWMNLTPSDACKASFWGRVTYNHIENQLIEPSYLAKNGWNDLSGLARINEALNSQDPKTIDAVARTIIRRFSGFPEARGGLRTVFVDCAFARLWWRERVVREVVSLKRANNDAVSETLRSSQTYWEKLIMTIISKNSVLGDDKVRTCLIACVSDHLNEKGYEKLFEISSIDKCGRLLGIQAAYQEMAALEVAELTSLINNEIFPQVLKN